MQLLNDIVIRILYGMMALLRIREIAQQRGLNLSQLQKKSGVDMATVRRYWYGTKNGSVNGEPLVQLNVSTLTRLAHTLRVSVKGLFNDAR